MIVFSSKTYVNKEFKLNDFLKEIKASKEIKEDAKVINSIIFSNVINANTINCGEEDEFKNIYIFKIILKEQRIPKLFIEELDKHILFHTYFIFDYNSLTASYLCFKDIKGKVLKLSPYYGHDFGVYQPLNIPSIDKVSSVYKYILEYEINIKSRGLETPIDYIIRVKHIKNLIKLIDKTEKMIKREIQPRLKFEYHNNLRKYKNELNYFLKEE